MNLDQANMKHGEWKLKFHAAISAKQSVDAGTISTDDHCEFGKWLHGEAKAKYGDLPGYKKCVRAHAAFHAEAGKIATVINTGKYQGAEMMLGVGTPFAEASDSVTGAILQLQKEVHTHHGVFLGNAVPA